MKQDITRPEYTELLDILGDLVYQLERILNEEEEDLNHAFLSKERAKEILKKHNE